MTANVVDQEKMTIKNFSQYLIEEEREVYFTFGRMNPPTIGHGKVMDTLSTKSGKADYKVYLSQVSNPKKDPLSYSDKIKHVRKMFPKHARNVMIDKNVRNVFDVASRLYDQGYKKITMVVGADRIREFDVLLNKYNGVKARHGFYNFQNIKVISAGERDPDAEGVEGMSASKQRENASKNDFVTFAQGVPKSMSNQDARKLFNDVRKGMGLEEERSFKNHIELAPVSETREQYVHGELYGIGDSVVIKETEEVGIVTLLGANYVIVETVNGKLRKWLDAVELVERQDPDIKDREGTQPARYHAGLKKSTKVARDAHFKKHGKKADDDDSAYKPAPGDASAKTKPSKYTKQFKDMYEEVSQKQINDLEKFGDRLLAKFDIDVEFTRHFADRMNDSRNKPAISVIEIQRLFKKIAKEKGENIKKHRNGEAVLKDIQSDLNLPVVVNFKNGEFEVVNKTIMRKKDFKTTSPVVKYESVSEAKVSVGDRVTLQPNKSVLDRSLIGKAGVVTGMLGRDATVKFANGKTILVSPRDLKINESVELDEMPRWMMDIIGNKLNPRNYKAALDALKDVLSRKKKETGGKLKHGVEYYAAQIGKSYNGVDARVLASLYRKAVTEETNPVDVAKAAISREKDADRAKHDRMLDRARAARTRAMNAKRNSSMRSKNRNTQ